MTNVSTQVEPPAERAERLIQEISASGKETYTRCEVSHLLNSVKGAGTLWSGLRKLDNLVRGDVFIAKVVGGKIRPWCVLSCRDGTVVAVAMSSGDSAPGMVKCESRYWSGWFGMTVSSFREDEARQHCSLPYGNRDHLREVERQLANSMGLRP